MTYLKKNKYSHYNTIINIVLKNIIYEYYILYNYYYNNMYYNNISIHLLVKVLLL